MEINVSRYSKNHSFGITGASYIGAPRSNTAMFVSKKVGHLISALANVKQCLVFAEKGLEVPESILNGHCFVFSKNPQGEYAAFTEAFFIEEERANEAVGYALASNGAYIGKNAKIGRNAIITITSQTKELGILVEGIAAHCVGYQTEKIIRAQIIDPGQGCFGCSDDIFFINVIKKTKLHKSSPLKNTYSFCIRFIVVQ